MRSWLLDTGWIARTDPELIGDRYPEELHYTHAADARWMRRDLGPFADRWTPVQIPADWNDHGLGEPSCLWFRTVFDTPDRSRDRWRIEFDSVDYETDVWLNENFLGSHEGCFDTFGYDISDLLRATGNHLVLRVRVPRDAPGRRHEQWQLKRSFRGALARWDMNDPEHVPGGIGGPVRLVGTGAARLDEATVRIDPLGDLDGTHDHAPALITASATLVVGVLEPLRQPVDVKVIMEIREVADGGDRGWTELARHTVTSTGGTHPISLTGRAAGLRLWWTWDLGDQPLYDVRLRVSVQGREPADSDVRVLRTASRRVERREGWELLLNGHPFYQRGANHLSDQVLASMTGERYRRDVELMREANLNTAHVFCVVERPDFYDECDRQGMLVYQDLPVWLMSDPESAVVREGVRQFAAIRKRLGHHPSIAIWNMGSQPSVANFEKLCSVLVRETRLGDPARIAHQGNATLDYEPYYTHPVGSFFWTRRTAQQLRERYDWRWDTHIYAGWYFDEPALADLPDEDFQLVTEFGAQALPDADFVRRHFGIEELDEAAWTTLAARGMQRNLMERHVDTPADLEELCSASQRYQAAVIRRHVETYRRRKFRPSRGCHVFAFADCWPSVSWSVLDYERSPKAAYHALARAMEPIQAFIDTARLVDARRIPITVVNDTRRHLSGAHVSVVIDDVPCTPIAVDLEPNGILDLEVAAEIRQGSDVSITVFDADIQLSRNHYSAEDLLPPI